jgi:hypothetical protein
MQLFYIFSVLHFLERMKKSISISMGITRNNGNYKTNSIEVK